MTELVITRGYSGSGKTTYAKAWVAEDPDNRVRVNRDNIRAMLTGSTTKTVLNHQTEALVTKLEEQAVEAALKAGRSVVVDDTNLRLKYARRWAEVATKWGVDFRVEDITTDLATCLERNEFRSDGVQNSVIENQARNFRMPWPEVVPKDEDYTFKPYVPDESLPTAYGFDLDGTLALNLGGRGWYDPTRYHEDTVNSTLLQILYGLYDRSHAIIIFSGRSEDHREVVEQWLFDNDVDYEELIMRKSGDNRDDAIVKSELFDEFVAPNYNFLAQFDDRSRVVDALRAKGITVYQVAPGAF